MDSLGKAFKTGLAKAYAAGQQQVQQRVSKLQDQSSSSKPPQGYGYGGGAQYGAGHHNANPPQVQSASAHDSPETVARNETVSSSNHPALSTGEAASYAQDGIGQLSTDLGKLNVSPQPPGSQPPPPLKSSPRATKRTLEPIKAKGEPNGVVRFCSETRVVDYALDWYHLEGVPSYLICTRCHADNVKNTVLESSFIRIKRPDGSSSICGFHHPRVKDVLWPSSLRSNDTTSLRAFMQKRLDIPACKGASVVTADDGLKWFGMAANDIDGFIACEACYEDSVVGSSFETRFTPYQQQGPNDKWICDMQIPYIMRAAMDFSRRNDWQGFVAVATKRCQLPVCEGKEVDLNSLTWYLSRRGIDNFHVCETCYLDKLAYTGFKDEFEAHPPKTGFDAWMDMLGKRRTCDLSSSKLPIAFALETALFTKDFDDFARRAAKISSLVPCTANGIIRGNWWTISGGCADFSICEACHTGIVQAHELDSFFEPVTRDAEATIVCSFCVTSPRFKQYMGKFIQAFDTGIFHPFTDFVAKFAGVQACAGVKSREKAKWWGYPEALFCENCYLSFVADTPLGSKLTFEGEYDERFQICQVWSPRMRGMWLKACEAGTPGSDESNAALNEFKEFASRRLQVWIQTVPRIEFIQQMKQMRMMNAMHQGQLSLMYSGMNSMAVLSDTTDGNLHGNSSIGWYETEHGATGAQLFNNMQSGMANANRGDEWAEVLRLSQMWTEVE
ncbi:hypothetical protein JDV02_000123 [Purpureocillium takamizusanense]|uniref:Integral membrane protein n=1 Tax=Purpureocillium takamizusanense TaxID=2060973 RepID=A0A9Q8Q450_9HYPO|nr:uncharacterized protein JDV02_000123 [Purpureocillium takamizusanense]UNI13373.1 hypothetical protein JDV02_000123 [Purpureocillium takamizusanense]